MPDSDGEVEDDGDLWSDSESVATLSTSVGVELEEEEEERREDETNVRERLLAMGNKLIQKCFFRQMARRLSRMVCSRLMWLNRTRSLRWQKKNIL